jgi:hypothetical protein
MASTLAKLTRPKLHQVVPRERLFDTLDRCRERPLTWVPGPPGGGKTALLASYLQARKLAGSGIRSTRAMRISRRFSVISAKRRRRLRARHRRCRSWPRRNRSIRAVLHVCTSVHCSHA